MPQRLDETEIKDKLQELSDWQRQGDHIHRTFKFQDFDKAVAFINKVAIEANHMDHHPDLNLHDWNQVTVTLTTHSAKGITANDIELAEKIQGL